MRPKPTENTEEAEVIALKALGFLASEPKPRQIDEALQALRLGSQKTQRFQGNDFGFLGIFCKLGAHSRQLTTLEPR